MGVIVGVLVEVLVAVGKGVLVGEGVNVGLSVAVGTGVAVCVTVLVGVSVGMFVLVGVSVGVGIGVDVLVGVFTGVAAMTASTGVGVDSKDARKRRMSSLVMPANASTAIIPTIASIPQSMTLPQPTPSELAVDVDPLPPPLRREETFGVAIPASAAFLLLHCAQVQVGGCPPSP